MSLVWRSGRLVSLASTRSGTCHPEVKGMSMGAERSRLVGNVLCPYIYSTDLNDFICKIESAVRPLRYTSGERQQRCETLR